MKIEPTVVVSMEIEPDNIYQAIQLFTFHIHKMYIAYNILIWDAKKNGTTDTITKSKGFGDNIKKAFDRTSSITSDGFIEYVEKFILSTTDSLELQKVYNFISEKLKDLESNFKRLRFNPIYPYYKSLLFEDDTPVSLFLYLDSIGQHYDINGNYVYNDYFTADNLFDTIVKDLGATKQKMDSLFSIKKLNEIIPQQPQPIAPTEQPQKQIEPIKWNGKKKNDLAYLFWKLQKENIISLDDFGLTLSKIFIDSAGNPIKNTLFNKYTSEFNKNQFPANANEIDALITILKKGID